MVNNSYYINITRITKSEHVNNYELQEQSDNSLKTPHGFVTREPEHLLRKVSRTFFNCNNSLTRALYLKNLSNKKY